MTTADHFRIHEDARIRTGKYAGLAGTVTDQQTEGDKQTRVRVRIEGAKDGQPVQAHLWLKRSAVGRLHDGGA